MQQQKEKIFETGSIDAGQVKELEIVLFADEKIDTVEAEFLFELNNAISGKHNASDWNIFSINAISGHLLEDENSAGEIKEQETQ